MKKFLLITLLHSFILTANAQTQAISFEASEGYQIGNLAGQDQWDNWGYTYADYSKITDQKASEGTNSVEFSSNDDQEGNWGGILYPVPNYSKFEVSADVFVTDFGGSDFDLLSLYHMADEYVYLNGFYFDYEGYILIGGDDYIEKTWTENTWYNLKTQVDFEAKTVKNYIDNVLVQTFNIPAEITSIEEVDFETDNYGTKVFVDNFVLKNLDNLNIEEMNQTNISIYPNPVVDVLNIDTNEKIVALNILDLTGKNVLTSDQKTLDLKPLPQGVYIVQITTENQTISKKIIKK